MRERERRGGKLIGRDFGAVSLKKNKGVAHHGMNEPSLRWNIQERKIKGSMGDSSHALSDDDRFRFYHSMAKKGRRNDLEGACPSLITYTPETPFTPNKIVTVSSPRGSARSWEEDFFILSSKQATTRDVRSPRILGGRLTRSTFRRLGREEEQKRSRGRYLSTRRQCERGGESRVEQSRAE